MRSEEAVSLLISWRDDESLISFIIHNAKFSCSFNGMILEIDKDHLLISADDGDPCHGKAKIQLSKCMFQYTDSSYAPQPSVVAELFSDLVVIRQQDGTEFRLFKYRSGAYEKKLGFKAVIGKAKLKT